MLAFVALIALSISAFQQRPWRELCGIEGQLARGAQHPTSATRRTRMLWTIFAILLLLWLLGWGFHIAGSLIHLILVIALVVLVIELITGRRAAI
jgi:hypothetical protein